MLEDRDAKTLADWLRRYPAIRIVARDRAGVYAEAATKGAPQATQVADRFHLLQNLAETLLSVMEQHGKSVREATRARASGEPPPDVVERAARAVTKELAHMLPPPTLSPKHQAQAEQRRATRCARYERARELHAQGWPIRAIGRELGLNRNTVRSYIRAPCFPERQPRVLRQPGVLDPYISYLIERWNAGCRNGTALWKEIIEQGYTGKRVTVFSFVTRLRKALGIPAKNRTIQTGKVAAPDARPLTPRTAVWQVLERPEKRDATTIQSNLHAVLAARLRHRAAQCDRLADLHRHRQYCPMADGAEKAGVAPGEQLDTWSGASHCNTGCFFERFGLIFLTEVARISATLHFSYLRPTRSQADPASLRQPPKQ